MLWPMRLTKPYRMPTRIACETLEQRQLLAFSGLPIQIGSNNFDSGSHIATTADGGLIATGLFAGTVDFDPGAGVKNLTSQGDTDIYIAKYDSAGALVWVRQIGGTAKSNII